MFKRENGLTAKNLVNIGTTPEYEICGSFFFRFIMPLPPARTFTKVRRISLPIHLTLPTPHRWNVQSSVYDCRGPMLNVSSTDDHLSDHINDPLATQAA